MYLSIYIQPQRTGLKLVKIRHSVATVVRTVEPECELRFH